MASRHSSTRNQSDAPKGRFSIGKADDGWTTVKYELSEERIQRTTDPEAAALAIAGGVELLRINADKKVLTIFPVNTFPNKPDFLQPRYESIRSISLEGFDIPEPESPEEVVEMLEYLPSGFLKDPEYGLGLQTNFRFIVQAIGQIESITELLVSKRRSSDIVGDTYVLSHRDFEAVRKSINRIHSQAVADAHVDKSILAHNALLTERLPEQYPKKYRPYKVDSVFKAVTGGAAGAMKLSAADKAAALSLVSANKRDLATRHPQELLQLRREIELVTLEQLIEKLQKMIAERHGSVTGSNSFSTIHSS